MCYISINYIVICIIYNKKLKSIKNLYIKEKGKKNDRSIIRFDVHLASAALWASYVERF
jgi:hypothetical protein